MKSEASEMLNKHDFLNNEKNLNNSISGSVKENNLISQQKYLSSNSGFIKITEDGLILKKITLKGFGKSTPINGEEAFVNYFAELEDGRSVDNTLILREPKQILMGRNSCLPGLELGIKSMLTGEKAKIVVFPEYGYILHEELSKKIKETETTKEKLLIDNLESLKLDEINYPSLEDFKTLELKDLKKYSPIIYDIELVKIDKPRKIREHADVDEKITEANDLKSEGNQLFREKRYREALIKYTTGLSYFFKIPTEVLKTNKFIDLKLTLVLNIINCHIALFEYNYALKRLPEAFEIKETPKCYFYRALACMNLGDFDQAQKDIEKLKNLIPNDSQVLGLEQDLKNLKEKTLNEKKSIFKKGIFMQTASDKIKEDYKEKSLLPVFNEKNFCFYLDILINNNTKAPQKVKFEIFDIFHKGDNEKNFINYMKLLIKEKRLVDKYIETIGNDDHFYFKITQIEPEGDQESNIDLSRFLDYDKTKYKTNYLPSEDEMLGVKQLENGKLDLVIIPFKIINTHEVQDLNVIGRMFYNNENFKNISKRIKRGEKHEIRITDCDRSLNI